MKNAIIAAVVAALVASTTTYAATGLINGARIKNHTIAAKKLSRKAVRQLHGLRGRRGPQGEAGLIDLSKLGLVDSGDATVAPGATGSVSAACPSGTKVVGGGFAITHGNDDKIDTYSSGPDAALTAWSTKVTNGSHSNATVHAYAICVSS
ncbi:MAG: hypothetical protein ACJ75L_08155 [Gaiellaceae bacterium]